MSQPHSAVSDAYMQEPAMPSAEGILPVSSSPSTHEAQVAGGLLQKIIKDNDTSLVDDLSAAGTRRPRIILGVSGSVATIKVIQVAELLLEFADVIVVSTESARHFFDESALPASCQPLLTDEDEWKYWKHVGDPVVHIELRKWGDAFIIAPLSANTLAKMANGLCDNLLTCIARAWDMSKPILVAPAMNTFMWESAFTEQHLEQCHRLGMTLIPPVSKKLACGDIGVGGMASPEDVAAACKSQLHAAGYFTDA